MCVCDTASAETVFSRKARAVQRRSSDTYRADLKLHLTPPLDRLRETAGKVGEGQRLGHGPLWIEPLDSVAPT